MVTSPVVSLSFLRLSSRFVYLSMLYTRPNTTTPIIGHRHPQLMRRRSNPRKRIHNNLHALNAPQLTSRRETTETQISSFLSRSYGGPFLLFTLPTQALGRPWLSSHRGLPFPPSRGIYPATWTDYS